ncbi:hypothetical protein PF004_g32149 [Phytophthora fragariae]|uniref:Uncharacterized protein n=1 Tax=Phytophthora fragariae TaxID=53985 RepID=A0A6G0M870_9STRA|nr:hypothetical protein PF004_g32149 [Phytophthora fragariae]
MAASPPSPPPLGACCAALHTPRTSHAARGSAPSQRRSVSAFGNVDQLGGSASFERYKPVDALVKSPTRDAVSLSGLALTQAASDSGNSSLPRLYWDLGH